MENNWAAENLQTIRTLMERSAIYRRALAPVMIFVGAFGMLAAVVGGRVLAIHAPLAFVEYWMIVGVVSAIGVFLLVRQQALKEGEKLWSPPTRRVVQAILPPLMAGFLLGVIVIIVQAKENSSFWAVDPPTGEDPLAGFSLLPTAWAILYGCALHSAGFFTPRGLKLLGCVFILLGNAVLIGLLLTPGSFPYGTAHILMGFFFGAMHLAYGIYLYFTEPRKPAA